MFTELNSFFKNICRFDDATLEEIDKSFEVRHFPKKTQLLRQGEICRFEGFVVKGCLKTYFLNEAGHEVILTFPIENWWVSDIASFHEQKPSRMFIETLEDCTLLFINPQEKEYLLDRFPKLERAYRLMVQRHLATYQERHYQSIAMTAEERYEAFLERYPSIPHRVPQHLIASYLGVSPEFLSRIRSRKVK
ncbi:MAG: Crp/Fnr family transcriptional regulator [Spirosomaceae bacterium]|jgi:CRP-like cAMP-binding protein|nr:Crp/Fnr family transcriptional regulator [Spirosomataceae bacterium]